MNFVDPSGLGESPPDCGPGTTARKDAKGDWRCTGTGVSVVTVTGSWDDMSGYLPNWGASGSMAWFLFPIPQQSPSNPLLRPVVDPTKRVLDRKLSAAEKEKIRKQVAYENCFQEEMKGPMQELRTEMIEDVGIAGGSSGLVTLVGGPLWGMATLWGGEAFWFVDVRRFERNTLAPAREAAKKKCKEKVGL